MRDLNFFESYIEKREFKLEKRHLLYGLLLLSIIGIVGYSIVNQIRIGSLNAEIYDRKQVAEDPVTVKKVEEIKALEAEVNTFRDEVNKIIAMDKSLEAKDIIGEDLLIKIRSKMPVNLFLSNFSAYEREIQITGIAKDTYSIAEFSKGLELMEESESIFVSSINSVEDYYNFVLNLTLKDVSMDGNETAKEGQVQDETPNQE
ncbi:hypothetical protein E9840_00980 [Tissierella creatinini]|nr:hypothetical protein E9840_00980 [Tissierella creatinini]TJX69075.1 hypothetical protein E8P77_00140 [Soehngenia saccharolytica]